jgi:hypothetical protein
MHNRLGLTEFVEPKIAPFWGRPYQVPHAERFSAALDDAIESPVVRGWPRGVGAVAQFAHSTDLLDWIARCRKMKVVYE